MPAFVFLGYTRWQRQKALDRYANECPAAAAASDWKRLQRVSLEWLDATPSNPHARFWLGEALQQQEKYDEAIRHFEQLPIDQPRGIDAAIRCMNIELFIKGKPSDAMKSASRLLEKDPSLADPIRLRIYFFAMTFQRDRLLAEINTAIRHRADLPEHFVYLMLLEDLSFRDGVGVVEKWLTHDEHYKELLTDSLFAHQILKAREEAISSSNSSDHRELDTLRAKCRERAVARSTNNIILELAIRLELDGGHLDSAGALLEKVPESAAGDPAFWLHRGKFALDGQEVVEARASFEKAIQLHPLAWRARSHLATVCRLEGDVKTAQKLQKLSADGAFLAGECLRLNSSRDVSSTILREIARFARECEDVRIAEAIDRRGM